MSNKVKGTDVNNRTYYFVNDIINTKNFDPNNINIGEKSYKNILIYYTGYVVVKDLKYVKIYNVNLCTFFLTKEINTLRKLMEVTFWR